MAEVNNSIVAVTSINNQDGLPVHNQAQDDSSVSPIQAYQHYNKTQATDPSGGKVTNDGLAVPAVNNHDGILIDYYTPYNGNGSTDAGWPAKDKWISFMDMCVRYTRAFIHYVLRKYDQVQQQQMAYAKVVPPIQSRPKHLPGNRRLVRCHPVCRRRHVR